MTRGGGYLGFAVGIGDAWCERASVCFGRIVFMPWAYLKSCERTSCAWLKRVARPSGRSQLISVVLSHVCAGGCTRLNGPRTRTRCRGLLSLRALKRRTQVFEQEERDPVQGGGVLRQEDLPTVKIPARLGLADGGVLVARACRVLGVHRQYYYRWLKKPVTDAENLGVPGDALFDAHRG